MCRYRVSSQWEEAAGAEQAGEITCSSTDGSQSNRREKSQAPREDYKITLGLCGGGITAQRPRPQVQSPVPKYKIKTAQTDKEKQVTNDEWVQDHHWEHQGQQRTAVTTPYSEVQTNRSPKTHTGATHSPTLRALHSHLSDRHSKLFRPT